MSEATTTPREPKKRGLQRALLQFVMDNPGTTTSVEKLYENVPGWTPSSYSSALHLLIKKYPDKIERIGNGVYKWSNLRSESELESKKQEPQEILVRVLGCKDGKMLVQDEESHDVYVMQPLTF